MCCTASRKGGEESAGGRVNRSNRRRSASMGKFPRLPCGKEGIYKYSPFTEDYKDEKQNIRDFYFFRHCSFLWSFQSRRISVQSLLCRAVWKHVGDGSCRLLVRSGVDHRQDRRPDLPVSRLSGRDLAVHEFLAVPLGRQT